MPAVFIETREIPVGDLKPFPGNARRGDVPRIRGSIRRNGQYRSLVVRDTGEDLVILAGNHTLQALVAEGRDVARCEIIECDDDEAVRINVADNYTGDAAETDEDALVALLHLINGDYEGAGLTEDELNDWLAPPDDDPTGDGVGGLTDDDDIPDEPADPVSQPGDLWLLGPHRLLCGDSTNPADVARLVDGARLTLIHADPPYGMGKESDGVLNDNLYGVKLDAFQMEWWRAWRAHTTENASAYIWGNAPDLWRLWWRGGLAEEPELMVRNEIVWDKGSGIGMKSDGQHCYPTATERCLFLMMGQQFLGNVNKDAYWEGYEPFRLWMVGERDRMGWTQKTVNEITDTHMAGHWFGQSQFQMINDRHYRMLADAAGGRAFTRPLHEVLEEMFPDIRTGGNAHRRDLSAALREQRSHFDNVHEAMTDVWQKGRVAGDERHGHATPKPVELVERAIKSSSREGDAIGVPFGGTGPEFIAAHRLDRVVYAMELSPAYVDTICRRFQGHTGIVPRRVCPDGTVVPVDFTVPYDPADDPADDEATSAAAVVRDDESADLVAAGAVA